jgi:hypothetical protein
MQGEQTDLSESLIPAADPLPLLPKHFLSCLHPVLCYNGTRVRKNAPM